MNGEIQQLVTQTALDFLKSRLTERETALLRAMAAGGQLARTVNNQVMVGQKVYEEPELVLSLQNKLRKFEYVGFDDKQQTYFLTPKGNAAAFSPTLSKRTWTEIGLLAVGIAVVVAALAIAGWKYYIVPPPSPNLPIGSIIAWHKLLADSPIPPGWVECNGPIGASDSAFDRASKIELSKIPNLNKERRFLRGGETSGQFEEESIGPHQHTLGDKLTYLAVDRTRPPREGKQTFGTMENGIKINELPSTGLPNSDGTETRPVNMSVVWIIRIK